jgi:hypothetical protein
MIMESCLETIADSYAEPLTTTPETAAVEAEMEGGHKETA